MSREIKFRGYDEENNVWRCGFYTKLQEGARIFHSIIVEDETAEERLTYYYIHNPKTIGQYTGLKDKMRGNAEVYQGDVYKWCGLTLPITIDDYHGYRFMFGEDQLCRAFIENGEYTGNIHEDQK